ncbi:hypothetical protein CHY_0366 [Carboxydothermus hydrogenoformans Z-2901]|uniref:Uncharacterized protein n=1 Tax=Carboxydothermus hydrogenoformans (strain ATCC BAA-161 / DSM 6008 / Z-2901) TaxID=246194 RepID=Q3AF55_CARHZ|nr:hypothetical protein CHY_0366 [Carboxydothermus hydrogenoformans Z-2901]
MRTCSKTSRIRLAKKGKAQSLFKAFFERLTLKFYLNFFFFVK